MKRENHGLTLIELLVTVAVITVLVTVGVPQTRDLITSNRMATQSNMLAGDIAYARSEAVRRAAPVNISSRSGSTAWTNGWVVWVDTNGNGAMNAGEELRIVDALPGTSVLTGTVSTLQYTARGALDLDANAAEVTFTLCRLGDAGDYGRRISVSPTGRPRFIGNVQCAG